MFGDVSEGAVVPRAPYRPPEKAFLLISAGTTEDNKTTILITTEEEPGFYSYLEVGPSYPESGPESAAPLSPNFCGYRTVSGAPSTTIP